MIQAVLVKWVIIFGGVLLVLVSSYLYGYIGGRANIQTKWDQYKADIAIEVQNNVLAAKKQELENDKNTYAVASLYGADIARLNDALNRMRVLQSAAPRPVPPTPNLPKSSDELQLQPAGGAADYEFYSNCLRDAIHIEAVKNWVTLQKIPVE